MRVRKAIAAGGLLVALVLGGCSSKKRGEPMSPVESTLNKQVELALDEEIPVNFRDTRLIDAFDLLRTMMKVPLYVDWDALRYAGIEPDRTVTVQTLSPAKDALLRVCGQASADLPPGQLVGVEVIHGVIVVSLNFVLDQGGFRPFHAEPTSPESASAIQAFNRFVQADWRAARLDQMLSQISRQTQVDFFVDWEALKPLGIEPSSKMDMIIGNAPADFALHQILRRINRRIPANQEGVGYGIIDGVMCISTGSRLVRIGRVISPGAPATPGASSSLAPAPSPSSPPAPAGSKP